VLSERWALFIAFFLYNQIIGGTNDTSCKIYVICRYPDINPMYNKVVTYDLV